MNGARGTPLLAILFTTLIAFLLIVTGDLSTLADMTVLLLVLVFAVVNASVLILRRDPVDHDHLLLTGPRGPFQTEELEALKG